MLPSPASTRRAKPQLASLLATAQQRFGFTAVGGSDNPAMKSPNGLSHSHEGFTAPAQDLLQKVKSVQLGLPSPTTTAFIVSCLLWYLSSALSSNTSKALLSSPKNVSPRPPPPFPYPVTLTLMQFFFVHILSAAVASPTITRHIPGMRKPVTRIVKEIGWSKLMDMAKLSGFNVVGHALSTVAISRVPVSTVHTIKALTPLFTVMSFHFIFHVHYSFMTYLSLLPLTLGVMMACTSLSFSANDLVGLSTALASTLIFVAQSIYSKNLIGRGEGASKHDKEGKLDKVNILYYSSACSVIIMIPMALYYDGPTMLFGSRSLSSSALHLQSTAAVGASASALYIITMVIANGVVQFFQNFLAFSVLTLVSPVTYSIASLFKRVFVICFAIVWFGQSVGRLQWAGIVMTFLGLYMYNDSKASKSISKGEEKLRQEEKNRELVLPTTNSPKSYLSHESKSSGVARNAYQAWSAATPSSRSLNIVTGGQASQPSAAGSGYRDMSSQADVVSPSSSRRMVNSHRADLAEAAVIPPPFFKDPRAALPSPPPSRGPSSDEEDNGTLDHRR